MDNRPRCFTRLREITEKRAKNGAYDRNSKPNEAERNNVEQWKDFGVDKRRELIHHELPPRTFQSTIFQRKQKEKYISE